MNRYSFDVPPVGVTDGGSGVSDVPVPVVPICGVVPLSTPVSRYAIVADRVDAELTNVGSVGTPAPV